MTSERPALVPCPFCGDDMDSFAGMTKDAFVTGLNSFAIGCDCGAIGPMGTTMSEAVNVWNNRQERLRDLLRDADKVVIWEHTPARAGFQEEIEDALGIK